MTSRKSMSLALVAIAAVGILAAGCGESTAAGPNGTTPGGAPIDGAKALTEAKTATEAALKGTNRPVSTTARPVVKNKKLAIVSSSMAVSSSKIPATGAAEAGEAAGWDVKTYDAQLQPAKYPELVRQAVAAGADGIILVSIDCKDVKQPLQEAKDKGVAVTSVFAYDCNDPRAGAVSDPLFTANTNFGPEATDIVAFTEKYGADQARYIVADSDNAAKIIQIDAPEFTVLNHTSDGFKKVIDQSGGSEIVSTIEITQADLATQQVLPKVQVELQKHPEATWIKSPFSYVTTLGIAPALGAQAGKIKVMGGEGHDDELQLIRDGKVSAVNVISSTWNGWSAVDTLNSVWRKEAPADSGIGWTLVDAKNGLPASGDFVPPVDFRAAYKKAWGIS